MTEGVSFTKDKGFIKEVIKESECYESPAVPRRFLDSFTPKVLELTAGNGVVCDALNALSQYEEWERGRGG